MDRFFGQRMSQAQIERVRTYFVQSPPWERPVWAKCMCWFHQGEELLKYPDCGWDFGLWQDVLTMQCARKVYSRPFEWAARQPGNVGIWQALTLRKEAFERMSFDRESTSMRMPTEMMGDNEFMRNSSAQLLS